MHYNWIEEWLAKSKNLEITFSEHLFDRQAHWKLNLSLVKETIRTGNVNECKCKEPAKLCFERYYGKENVTYIVIALLKKDEVEVKTAWLRQGK
jgi:hypothetical protein